jgi:hypothetical protein
MHFREIETGIITRQDKSRGIQSGVLGRFTLLIMS